MKKQAIATIVYGLIILLGGVIGYAKAHSYPSLIAGVFFASALLTCGGSMLKTKPWGYYGAIVLSLVLVGFFGYRFGLSGKLFPAGAMTLLSLITLSFLVLTKRK